MIVTGGALRPSDGGLVGPFTNQTIRQFKFDYAIIGCSALGEEGELFDFDDQEVEASRIILQSARTSVLVADGSKFCAQRRSRLLMYRQLIISSPTLTLISVCGRCWKHQRQLCI